MHQWSIGRPLLNDLPESSAAAEATLAATAEVVQKTVHEDQTEAVEEEISAVASSAALSESENSEDDMPLSQKLKLLHWLSKAQAAPCGAAAANSTVAEVVDEYAEQCSKRAAETLQRDARRKQRIENHSSQPEGDAGLDNFMCVSNPASVHRKTEAELAEEDNSRCTKMTAGVGDALI